jgi:hypothetical protein
MSNMFNAKSLTFYPGYLSDNCQELSDEIIIPSYHLNRIMGQFEDNEPLLVSLKNTENNLSTIVAISTPHIYDKNTVFVPQWVLDLIGVDGISDIPVSIKKANVSDVAIATKITIKPLDPVAFELDIMACFEKTMMNLHTIKEGITIPVNVPELGKEYTMFAYIEKVEPASLSRIVHGEVDVEFINEFEDKNTNYQIPTASTIGPFENTIIENNDFNEVLPSSVITHSMNNICNKRESDQNTITNEERRKRVRESWLKRFENNGE